MKRYTSAVLIAAALIFFFSWSCGSGKFFQKENEGVIVYDVTFPFEQNSLMLELYPQEMVFSFKDQRFHSSLRSAYGLLSTEFIIDNEELEFTQLLKSFSDRYALTLDEKGMIEWLKRYPAVALERTNVTDTIAGYPCTKSIARFLNDSVPSIELYWTDQIEIDATNWWNQFAGIDGFLLGYEVEQYGKRMKLRAREVRFEAVPDERFQIPQEYKAVDMAGMDSAIDALVGEYVN